MSTKTSIKRIALVAVAALGLGMVSTVAASAAVTDNAISAGASAPARVGVSSGSTNISVVSTTADTGFVVTAQITSAPATSTVANLTFSAASTHTATSATYTDTATATAANQTTVDSSGIASASFAADTTSGSIYTNVKLSLKADVAGTYQILVSNGGSTSTGYSAGLKSAVYTITTAGTPATIALTKLVGTIVGGATNGAVLGVSLKDANGNATVLGLNEAIKVSHTGGSTLTAVSGATSTSFGSGSSQTLGNYLITNVGTSTGSDTSDVVTVAGDGLLSSTLTTNLTVGSVAAAATTVAVGKVDLTDATGFKSTTAADATHNAVYDSNGSSFGLTVTYDNSAGTSDVVIPVDVTVTGGISFATSVTIAAGKKSGTFTVSQALSSTVTAVSIAVGSAAVITFNYSKAVATTVAIQGSTTVLSATGGSTTWVAKTADQYGNAMANIPVTVTVSGRNTVSAVSVGSSDANGLVSYKLTDAGTTGTSDSVTFSDGTHSSAAATVLYGTVTVGTITVSGGSKAETVAGSTLTAISAADNGPEGSAVAISAVVKDANGNLLAGVPVTFSVDKGLIKKTAAVDYSTVYTGSNGKATSYVFNWTPGTQTITATAGGKSSTDYLTWAATDATSARVLSATANGNVVSVKVVDRFGNAVKGVSVDLSRVGTGFFGNGTSTATVKTDATGTADIQFNGTATVTATLDTAVYTQSADVAGEIDATAVTAAVAGTTKGTGASLAPAGVNKVTVDLSDTSSAAVDAANEATDAANAATDAANAAAEAADAATAAAQDAQAAVAELATQVAALIAGIKAQITSLTNLVIKIQKKVKA